MPPIKKPRKSLEAKYAKGAHPDMTGLIQLANIVGDSKVEDIDVISSGHYDNGEKFITVEIRYKED